MKHALAVIATNVDAPAIATPHCTSERYPCGIDYRNARTGHSKIEPMLCAIACLDDALLVPRANRREQRFCREPDVCNTRRNRRCGRRVRELIHDVRRRLARKKSIRNHKCMLIGRTGH